MAQQAAAAWAWWQRAARCTPTLLTRLPRHAPPPQTWHWNEKRYIAQYYADLAKKEAAEELERQAAIKAKFAQLEQELLS